MHLSGRAGQNTAFRIHQSELVCLKMSVNMCLSTHLSEQVYQNESFRTSLSERVYQNESIRTSLSERVFQNESVRTSLSERVYQNESIRTSLSERVCQNSLKRFIKTLADLIEGILSKARSEMSSWSQGYTIFLLCQKSRARIS